jgi:hypothetical protein
MGQVIQIHGADAAPGFSHAAAAFVLAHDTASAWSAGTTVKYRQTLTTLAGQLAARAHLVAGTRLAGERSHRRVGPAQDRARHHPGADPRPGRRAMAAGRAAAGEDLLADAV